MQLPLSACIETIFRTEEPVFARRIDRCAEHGISRVEFWTWRDKELADIEAALERTGVSVTAFATEPKGRLVDNGTHDEFLAGLKQSIEITKRLRARALIVLAGDTLDRVPREIQTNALVEALRRAAPLAERAGVLLVLEMFNTVKNHPGYFLDRTTDALDIVDAVGSPAVRILFDLYHSAMMGEDMRAVLSGRVHLVGHVHIADTNGRHEPGTGTIDFRTALSVLSGGGYVGPIGLEFWPTGSTADSLVACRRVLAGPT
ncbi:MAG: TIM barrel protein [Hyphomicrobiales bacterium]|nr:TIM barrel protein [Hyphomicrobiales bacterium]